MAPRQYSIRSFLLGAAAVLVPLLVLVAAFVSQGYSARNKPGAMETSLFRHALNASFSARERNLRNPVPPSAEALTEARDHFADHCANCHANNGSGHTMYGDGLNPSPPDMRLDGTQGKTDGELYSVIQNGIRFTGMPAFGSAGDGDESTWKLVLFIRHLPSLTPEEEAAMQKANPITPSELKEQQEEDNFLLDNSSQPKGSKQ
jgi:mono/diheme cytochrome c family protein